MKLLQCTVVPMFLYMFIVLAKGMSLNDVFYKRASRAVINCPVTHFRCSDSSNCIPVGWQCDGEVDCEDASDEPKGKCNVVINCPVTDFRCSDSSNCIPVDWQCDGEEDCDDASDEPKGKCNEKDEMLVQK